MVVLSEPLSETHHGLVPERHRPQAFWRLASVVGATPDTLDTSGVTVNVLPGGPACVGTAATSPATMTNARKAPRTESRVIGSPFVVCSTPFCLRRRGWTGLVSGRRFSEPGAAACSRP